MNQLHFETGENRERFCRCSNWHFQYVAPWLVSKLSLATRFAPARRVETQIAPTRLFIIRREPRLIRDQELATLSARFHLEHHQHPRNVVAFVLSANGNDILSLLDLAGDIFKSRLAQLSGMSDLLAIDVNGSLIIRRGAKQNP